MELQPNSAISARTFSIVRIVAWIVLALTILAIGYAAVQALANWDAINV